MISRGLRILVSSLLLLHFNHHSVCALGGEKATLNVPLMSREVSFRQNVCDRHDKFHANPDEEDMRLALAGMQLNVVAASYPGGYFNYSPENGIDPQHPGIAALLLDELSQRGGFTWRESFAVHPQPSGNNTWTKVLYWGIDTFDVAVDWWDISITRLAHGVSYATPAWHDSSMILVTNQTPQLQRKKNVGGTLTNWLRPFTWDVWLLIVATVAMSGVVYQVIEWFGDDRGDRNVWEWWQENFYMSALNFTQAYEYQPKNASGRIFGVSMAVWALVMTATYTANLASLMVERAQYVPLPKSIDEIVRQDLQLCTWESTNADLYVQEVFPQVNRIPKKTLDDLYDGLRKGDCDYFVEQLAFWEQRKGMSEFNGNCDLYWVGGDEAKKVHPFRSSFALKADSGDLCTGFMNDVLNLHMADIVNDSTLDRLWDLEYQQYQDITCLDDPLRRNRRRLKESGSRPGFQHGLPGGSPYHPGGSPYSNNNPQSRQRRRRLKGGKGGAAGAAAASLEDGDIDAARLTVEQMLGTFSCLYCAMAIAVGVAIYNWFHMRYAQKYVEKGGRRLEQMLSKKHLGGVVDFMKSTSELGHQIRRASSDDNDGNKGVLDDIRKEFNDRQDQVRLQEDIEYRLQKFEERMELKFALVQQQNEQILQLLAGSSANGNDGIHQRPAVAKLDQEKAPSFSEQASTEVVYINSIHAGDMSESFYSAGNPPN